MSWYAYNKFVIRQLFRINVFIKIILHYKIIVQLMYWSTELFLAPMEFIKTIMDC
ncbi:MAG: hypothetical protein JWQ79_835 [Mucilaginibacter sp.]|nr:hypothetical protein [Mucilaginibacter sp.]